MSPSKLYGEEQARRSINLGRPAPLKINKDSHAIHKPSNSSSSSSFHSLNNNSTQKRHYPIIIYTHSPKVIHTKPRDFMAVVQRLTGLSHSDNQRGLSSSNNNNNNVKMVGHDDSTGSSSVVTDENCGRGNLLSDINQVNSSSVSCVFDPQSRYLPDIPLFTPNLDFSCSSRSCYINGTSMSPSLLEVIKGAGFSDY